MLNRNRLFANTINFNIFIEAVKKGDANTLDTILKAASTNSYEFDINKKSHGQTALQIALTRRDFACAAKLINAGAGTQIEHKVSVSDDSYWGSYDETTYTSLINLNRNDFLTLQRLIQDDITSRNNHENISFLANRM